MKKITSIIFIGILSMLSISAYSQNSKKTKILFVVTSHDKLGDTGEKTGLWIEEFATPYYYLIDQGVEVVVALSLIHI